MSNVAFWLIPTSILTILGFIFYFKNQFEKSFFSIAFGWIILSPILFLIIYPKLTAESPVEIAKTIIPKNSKVIVFKRFDPAFPINFQQIFPVSNEASEVVDFIEKNPKGFNITNDRNDYKLLQKNKNLELIFERKALFENHTTRIFKKKTNNTNVPL